MFYNWNQVVTCCNIYNIKSQTFTKKIERKVSDNIATALDSAVNTLFPTENVILSLDNDIFWKY